jgi:hypothetical protein
MSVTINASTSSGLVQSADTSGTVEIQSNGTTKFTVASTGAYGQITSGTAVASTSGTSIDFTSLPSWVKRITVMFSGVSTNGSSNYLIQVGSGSVTTSGYSSSASYATTSVSSVTSTAGFVVQSFNSAATLTSGNVSLCLISGNAWTSSGVVSLVAFTGTQFNAGNSSALSGALDRVRITTANGTDTFDAGTINILYEG